MAAVGDDASEAGASEYGTVWDAFGSAIEAEFRRMDLVGGSPTKSMCTCVDEGKFGSDQPAVDICPQFRAPTDDLTRTLRVRGGIDEPPALSGLYEGDPTAAQLPRSRVNDMDGTPRLDLVGVESVRRTGGLE